MVKFCKLTALQDGIKDLLNVALNGILIPFVPIQITSYKLMVLYVTFFLI